MNTKVGIIMGSDSDLEVMSDAAKVLEEFSVGYEISVLSTHRSPAETAAYAQKAQSKGLKVLIAGAGAAAALPGSLASLTTLPVIGVPIKSKSLEGIDSLLSIVQMPPGVPVATVAINGAKNAGILAVQILACHNDELSQKLKNFKQKLNNEAQEKNTKLKKIGFKKYLEEKG